ISSSKRRNERNLIPYVFVCLPSDKANRGKPYRDLMTSPERGPEPARFATTHWSLVVAAGGKDSQQAHQALAELCAVYWHPLYAYVRRLGYDVNEAQDLVQEFFTRL